MDEKDGYVYLNRYFEEVSEYTAEQEKKFFKESYTRMHKSSKKWSTPFIILLFIHEKNR